MVGVCPAMLVTPVEQITSGKPYLFFMMLGLCIDASLYLVFVVGAMASVHQESKMTLEKLKSELSLIQNMQQKERSRKVLQSLRVINIKFGGNNFVEKATPLNCIIHATNLCMQILLFQRSLK